MSKTAAMLVLLAANVMIANVSRGQESGDAPIYAAVPVLPVAPAIPDTKAPGSDPDFVWVNKNSHTYLCPKDDWYGKTKNGEYMSEWNAKALGYHAKYNKECNI